MEQTSQGQGKWYGVESTNISTGISTMRPDGTFAGEGHGFIATKDGDMITIKFNGVGSPTGKGWAATYRGAAFAQTASPKYAQASKLTFVWEYESGENGDYTLKVWEWK